MKKSLFSIRSASNVTRAKLATFYLRFVTRNLNESTRREAQTISEKNIGRDVALKHINGTSVSSAVSCCCSRVSGVAFVVVECLLSAPPSKLVFYSAHYYVRHVILMAVCVCVCI